MGRGLHIPLVRGQNTMGKWVFIPWIGGQNTMCRGRYTMGTIVDIPWVSGSKYHGWGGGQNAMDREDKIPWV